MTYVDVILISWVVFLIVWGVGAFNVKRDVKGRGLSSLWSRLFLFRVAIAALFAFVVARVIAGNAHFSGLLSRPVFVPSLALGWLGAACSVVGITFAIWARVHLGRNWSSYPTEKEEHELVTSGPYAYVRHPIYTGILLAGLGAALAGTFVGAFMFVFGTIVFVLRIGREERIMLKLFPDQYPAYQARTKRLIPFLW